MKKLLCMLLALTMLLSLGAPALAAGHEITKNSFPLYPMGMDMGMELTLYFLDGVNDLPYVELKDWMELLNAINGEEDGTGYRLSLETAGPIACYTRENGFTMIIDFDEDTFKFMDYNLFMKLPTMSTLLDFTSGSCFNAEGQPSLMKKSEDYSYDRYGDELVLRLGDYGIDLICQDGLYLVPMQTMNDFTLASSRGLNCFYNGQCVIVIDKLSPNDERYYAAPTGARSAELAEYGYNELCLMLDSLYGLKEIHEIDSFASMFDQIGFVQPLTGKDPAQADKAIYYMINKYLDDLHSGFVAYSYLTGPIDYRAEKGPSFQSLFDHRETNLAARAEKYPDGVPAYEEVGNTAYITFDHFEIKSEKYEDYYGYKSAQEIPFDDTDTFAMIIRAHEQITREGSPIENVVIDLSCNAGGSVDTAAFLIAWCLGKASISLKDNFTGAMANTDYWADVNLDREFDERDTIADKNIYCLISPVSFSCGNLVPNVFKQSGKVTLMGRTSGGGSCTVQPISSAWGTSFTISAALRMSFLKNGSLYDIDRGADPDYTISKPEKFYDRAALTDYINTLY